MLVLSPTLEELEAIAKQIGLPEPFVWGHWDGTTLVGVITGMIHDGTVEVDHMIVLPTCRTRFATLLDMSYEATAYCHARGLHVVVKIPHDDPRRKGLEAWAARCGYLRYAADAEVDWYVNYAPPSRAFCNGYEARAHAQVPLGQEPA